MALIGNELTDYLNVATISFSIVLYLNKRHFKAIKNVTCVVLVRCSLVE